MAKYQISMKIVFDAVDPIDARYKAEAILNECGVFDTLEAARENGLRVKMSLQQIPVNGDGGPVGIGFSASVCEKLKNKDRTT